MLAPLSLRLTTAAALAVTVAAPAFAGGFAEPIATPIVTPVTVAPPVPMTSNWGGGYVGLEANGVQLDFDDDLTATEFGLVDEYDGDQYGIHAGYRRDLGRFVLGGELAYTTGSVDIEGEDVDLDILRAGVQLGYDAGRVLPYLTAGGVAATLNGDADVLDYDTSGYFAGVGVDFALTERISLGGQYLYQDFNADDGDLDFTAPMLGLRATYNF